MVSMSFYETTACEFEHHKSAGCVTAQLHLTSIHTYPGRPGTFLGYLAEWRKLQSYSLDACSSQGKLIDKNKFVIDYYRSPWYGTIIAGWNPGLVHLQLHCRVESPRSCGFLPACAPPPASVMTRSLRSVVATMPRFWLWVAENSGWTMMRP